MTVWSRLPPLGRAFLRYTVRNPDPVLVPILFLEREVEAEVAEITDGIFREIERELGSQVREGLLECDNGADHVRFDYDTRLLLPAILTHGRLHVMANDLPLIRRWRSVDRDLLSAGSTTTREIVGALLDGDMRDALNDEEYEDFETNVRPRAGAARVAQQRLKASVEEWFGRSHTPPAVEEHYTHAVELSEGHQESDESYRELLTAYRTARSVGRDEAAERIRAAYKYADQANPPSLLEAELEVPYFVTQYERVGIIYEDMLRMYEADLAIDLSSDFKRSIVLMVIAAQIGLDDTDDYWEDQGEQLTPVTAELNLHGAETGVANLRSIVETYLDRAEAYSDDHLSGLAVEFIREQSRDRLNRLAASVD